VLPALLRVQRQFGFVSAEAIQAIAKRLRLTSSDVDGIASGYSELRRVPPADTVVRVCDGLSCSLAGADELRSELERGASSLLEVRSVSCLFACAVAPVVEINSRSLGRATLTSVLESLHSERDASAL
jgi:NADH:ubiquinone oxidoreductase subunit E